MIQQLLEEYLRELNNCQNEIRNASLLQNKSDDLKQSITEECNFSLELGSLKLNYSSMKSLKKQVRKNKSQKTINQNFCSENTEIDINQRVMKHQAVNLLA